MDRGEREREGGGGGDVPKLPHFDSGWN
jgi:hypothetical protein